MASSDFDDIFGDLKEDEQCSASLATGESDMDDAELFGDASLTTKSNVEKRPPVKAGPLTGGAAGGSQDEFLSWLDDEPTTIKTDSGPLDATPTPTSMPVDPPPMMDTIDLGDGDDHDDDFLATPPPRTTSFDDEPLESPASSEAVVNPLPKSIPVHIAAAVSPPTTISFDDDDDEDLETIVRRASAQARMTGSRESSHSSLGIKSHSHSRHHGDAGQFDVVGLTKEYNASGMISLPAARLAMWHHALCGNSPTKEAISMYAVQTTPLDLPNQAALRKDVEAMSSAIFASAVHTESLQSSTGSDGSSLNTNGDDGARLLFIDNAEILMTYVCKKLRLAEYPPGFAFAFGPAVAVGGNDPLRIDLLATIQAACHVVMPHLSLQIAPQQIAAARRALLKWLLLYHAPAVAFHLDQHFHQWNTDAKTIPDTWLASMLESDQHQHQSRCNGLETLVQIWDCCVLLDLSNANQLAATNAFPSTTACFVVVHLIAQAENKLLRMEGEHLRHCMAQTLVETLYDPHREPPLVRGVRTLIDATPPSYCRKLGEAGMHDPPSTETTFPAVDATANKPAASKSFSLLAASTNSVLQVGNAVGSAVNTVGSAVNTMVIDMPTKLLTTIVPIKFTSPISPSAKDPAVNEAFFTQLMRESTPTSSVSVTLAASDVIPHVFRSFQTTPPHDPIRYFIVDCRASDETTYGQIPTAFHFDPDAVTDPAVLDAVLATLTPLKKTVHLCVMGHGYGHIADDLRQLLAAQQTSGMTFTPSSSDRPFFLTDDFLERFARDISRVNAAVLFLVKRGFPHVSVLEGGYAAAHTQLLHSSSEGYSVADLIDHDAPQCSLCHHRRPSTSSAGSFTARTESAKKQLVSGDVGIPIVGGQKGSSPSASRGSSGAMLPQQLQAGPKLSGSTSGELDARALFDGHATPGASGSANYFSSFTGALKTGGKAMGGMMNPAATTMAGGGKWLMGMKTSSGGSSPSGASPTPTSPVSGPGGPNGDAAAATGSRSPIGMANLTKLKTSLSQIGSDSLDMLKKAEQAAVKTTPLKGMFTAISSSNLKTSGSPTGGPPVSPASMGTGGRQGSSSSLPRASSFQRPEEEVFTIDDDDDEEQDDFVGGGGGGGGSRVGGGSSRTSSTSSMTGHRTESFAGGSSTEAGGMASTVVLHTVEKGHVKDLTKGLRVSRTQMLPFVESPFFSAYKKKMATTTTTTGASPSSRASMLPRRLVVAEHHVLVLKAERHTDDVYCVKSCHHLSHLGRMTCLKKNALMVTMYYKWKAARSGDIVEKKNAYEVQQRDEFIRVIKTAMEKM